MIFKFNRGIFGRELQRVTFATWILKLIPIPIGIVSAQLMTKVVTNATDGNIHGVLITSGTFLSIVIGIKAFNIVTGIAYEKASLHALHRCKIFLYRLFLSNPFDKLYASEQGDAIENLNDDFKTVTGKSLSVYPNFWIGIITVITYFMFLGLKNFFIAFTLLIISLLQIIPPLIVKKYMQVNYDNCREIEANITDFIIEGYRGFAIIKLYDLKKWWIDKIKILYKEYAKIGTSAMSIGTTKSMMSRLLDNILMYGTYGLVGFFILLGYSSLEVGIEAIALSTSFFAAVKEIFSSIPNFAVAEIAEKRISRWLVDCEHNVKLIQSTDITFSDVSYSYNEKIILDSVKTSFDSEKICIIKGVNGTGKSTLFRLIIGLLQCDNGTLQVGAINPSLLADNNFPYKIFYLPQDDASFDFSARDLYEMIVPDKVVDAKNCALEFGLSHDLVSKSPISELSGGECKKVFLALACTLDSALLLLDEPTNFLDAKSKTVLCKKLVARKSGALIITHDSIFDNIAECVYTVKEGDICFEKLG